MTRTIHLESGKYYHIYNRGNNKEEIFKHEADYIYFLNLLTKHIFPTTRVFCYCLLSNHFHLLIQVKDEHRQVDINGKEINVAQSFSNFFNAYAKAFNKKYNRTGKLFAERFKRKLVEVDGYFSQLIFYIHANPQRHKIINDFRNYRYSSYKEIMSNSPTYLCSEEMFEWFGGKDIFEKYHAEQVLYLLEIEALEK